MGRDREREKHSPCKFVIGFINIRSRQIREKITEEDKGY
jgi:hypothetical protein